MKDLRTIRIFLSALFFAGSVAYLAIGSDVHPMARMVEKAQIVPSLIAVGMGTILVWIALTFVFGRIYCSTVCPIGTYQDIFMTLRRRIPWLDRPFSYRPPGPMRYQIVAIYAVCLLAGVTAVPLWLEPWNMMRNICAAIHPTAETAAWLTLGVGMGTGVVAGIFAAILLALCALFTGRGFCTDICPIGIALGSLHDFTLLHIEIDPDKCVNCLRCEDVCKSHCIRVSERRVDNSRCVRCFDCLKVCPNDAIRYQAQHNRRGTPLINKVGGAK